MKLTTPEGTEIQTLDCERLKEIVVETSEDFIIFVDTFLLQKYK